MALLEIEIKLLSPVILSSHVPDNNLTGTLDYIPASSLLGLFAIRYIFKENLKQAHKDDKFYSWFLKGDIIFTNAYIKEEYEGIDMLPTPLCIKKQKHGEKILNTLLDDVAEQTVSISPYSYIYRNIIKTKEPKKVINFHHTRDRLKGHTGDEGLFNYEALMPGQIFKGEIHGAPETLKEFKDVFGEEENIIARLGKSRNTEYGKVEIKLSEIKELDTKVLDEEDFEDNDYILLTFISPCILMNKNGFSDPSISNLERHFESIWGVGAVSIENCVMKTTTTENYISVWKMKRPLETAIMTGSTIKLNFAKKLSFEEINKGLLKIIENGIGERRGEGFGRVKINMVMSEEYFKKDINVTLKKPTNPVPEEAKRIFVSIIKDMFKQEFEIKAYNAAVSFNHLPSSSLLGKLELMLTNSQDYNFKSDIDDLRDKAKDQLRDCRNTKYTLYDHISKFNEVDVLKNIYRDTLKADYSKLAELAGYKIENDKDFLLELWRIYFKVLFKRMRQERKHISRKEACTNE